MIYLHEIYKIPFILPEDTLNPQISHEIINNVSVIVNDFETQMNSKSWFGLEEGARNINKTLESQVRKYYNIDEYEEMLIDETISLSMNSFHRNAQATNIPTLKQPEKLHCRIYTRTLCEMLNHFGKGNQFKVKGEVFKGSPYSVVHISLVDKISKDVPVSEAKEKLASAIKKMESLLQEKKSRFVFCKNLKAFDGDSLYILKPMQMRFWSRTAALNDADEIAGYILQIRRNS